MSEFIFNARLRLFNTRREHEWRVITGALVIMGTVDYAIIQNGAGLNSSFIGTWHLAVSLLCIAVVWFQCGIQMRNRVDRLAMDELLVRMCGSISIHDDSCIRAGIERAGPKKKATSRCFLPHLTYSWAFIPEMLVVAAAGLISWNVPDYVHNLPSEHDVASVSAEPATHAANAAPKSRLPTLSAAR